MNQTTKTTSIDCLGILMKLFIDLLVHILGICLLLLIITFLGFAFLNSPLYSSLNFRLYVVNKGIKPLIVYGTAVLKFLRKQMLASQRRTSIS